MKSQLLAILVTGVLTTVMVAPIELASPQKVEAQALVSLNLKAARNATHKLTVYAGRISIIDFSATHESIIAIKLGDSSRTVYSTDIPLDTGKAKTIFVEAIQPLSFPGATTARVTNLAVTTIEASGSHQLYLFDIFHGGKAQAALSGIRLVPGGAIPQNGQPIWKVDRRTATLPDIERGLSVAIERGWTRANDPVVRQVQEVVALGYNSGMSLEEAAEKAGLSLAVLSELAEIGLDNRLLLPFRFIPEYEPETLKKPGSLEESASARQ
jgi:hypothetical protein